MNDAPRTDEPLPTGAAIVAFQQERLARPGWPQGADDGPLPSAGSAALWHWIEVNHRYNSLLCGSLLLVLSMELIGMAVGSILLGGLADKIGRCETKIDKFMCPHPDGKEPCSQRSPQFPPDGISFIGLSNFKHVVRNIKVDKPLLSAARDRARQMCGPDSEMIKLRDQYIIVKGDYREDVCLDILYMTRVATYAWGLTLPAVTAADDTDQEWPLGAMFMQIAQSTNKTAP